MCCGRGEEGPAGCDQCRRLARERDSCAICEIVSD